MEPPPDKFPDLSPATGAAVVEGVQRGKTGGTNSAPTRKLGRNPRVPFTSGQVAILEQKYQVKQYLSSIDVAELSTILSLNDSRVSFNFLDAPLGIKKNKNYKNT